MKTSFSRRWANRTRIGAKASIFLHLLVMTICLMAIQMGTAVVVCWGLFAANAIGVFAIGVKWLTDPYVDE